MCGQVTAQEISGAFFDTGDLNCKFVYATDTNGFELSVHGLYAQPFTLPFTIDTTNLFSPNCAGSIDFIVTGKAHPCGLIPPLGNHLYVTYFKNNRTLVFYVEASRTASAYANHWVQQDNRAIGGTSKRSTIPPFRNYHLNCRCNAVSCINFSAGSLQGPAINPSIASELCVMQPNGTVIPCNPGACQGAV